MSGMCEPTMQLSKMWMQVLMRVQTKATAVDQHLTTQMIEAETEIITEEFLFTVPDVI